MTTHRESLPTRLNRLAYRVSDGEVREAMWTAAATIRAMEEREAEWRKAVADVVVERARDEVQPDLLTDGRVDAPEGVER